MCNFGSTVYNLSNSIIISILIVVVLFLFGSDFTVVVWDLWIYALLERKKKKKTVWAKLLGEMENDVWFFWPQTLLIEDPLLIVKRPNNISFSYVQ